MSRVHFFSLFMSFDDKIIVIRQLTGFAVASLYNRRRREIGNYGKLNETDNHNELN